MHNKNNTILQTIKGEKTSHTPVWFMRQAGRSQPEYRKLKEKYSLFDITHQPELCAYVTQLPVDNYNTDAAVLLGMVYNFLPFMILPIHTILSKMDQDLINAAKDLGANNFQVFTKVIFPLSLPGVISGITMVFMPAVSTFVISKLLGGGQFYLIGNLIEQEFMSVGDWHFGSAISIFMMIIILISMAIMNKYSSGNDKEGGGLLL